MMAVSLLSAAVEHTRTQSRAPWDSMGYGEHSAYGVGVWERERGRGNTQHKHLSMLGVCDRNAFLAAVEHTRARVHPVHERVPKVDSSCRLLIVPLFIGSSRFESLMLSHHSRYKVTCECSEEDINDDDDDDHLCCGCRVWVLG